MPAGLNKADLTPPVGVTVSFVDSLRLFDVLIKLGKPFESQIYPGEIHFFRRDIVLRDAWRRVEDFFDRNLKSGPNRGSDGGPVHARPTFAVRDWQRQET